MKTKDMKMKSVLSKTYLWLLLLFAFSLPLTPFAAKAGSVIADSPCDNAYYESLTARAWLEAQREITQNQNIILKPDSVLQYTCFDQLVWELGDHADEMLSETNYYGTPLNTSSMDNALNNLVLASIGAFASGNYTSLSLLSGHPAGTAIQHKVSDTYSGSSSYSCDVMKQVWHAAKCINFINDAEYDGFHTFSEYATNPLDKRHLPSACMPLMGNWATNLASALSTGPWTNDPLQTYQAQTTPQTCSGANCPCSGNPIPTGVVVSGQSPGPASYDEKICLQPGCRYHPGGFPLVPSGSDVAEGCYGN